MVRTASYYGNGFTQKFSEYLGFARFLVAEVFKLLKVQGNFV